ncbi:hypothetical protein Q5P01_025709 [Channa striata]|uniref:Glycosyl hydrolases family 22 (GH22) domain-containing protein n=1 Tax=Channa striata TaxID=64152 RepID=A0AA88IXC4_CHASR|nr:hypothetical protein Q5P01_025709 [Channa striata]
MKLGLLVVLAVAASVPSLSEGRIVSKCELKEKLDRAITLPRKLQKYKENILATALPGTAMTATNASITSKPANTTNEPTTTIPTTVLPGTATNASITTEPTNTTTTETTTQTLALRRKREVKRNRKECDSLDRSLKELLEKEEDESDEEFEEDNKRMGDEDKDRIKPRTLGLYGIFQLSDSHFCDSGYCRSRNECRTNCSAFTDDDITDDIACLVKTDYWWSLLKTASDSCFNTCNFFRECEE